MADQEDEELQMALKMSMMQQDSIPVSVPVPVPTTPQEPKRNKPCGESPPDESPEIKNRRLQRELMAAAAEKRMTMSPAKKSVVIVENAPASVICGPLPVKKGSSSGGAKVAIKEEKKASLGEELAEEESKKLFSMVFGGGVTKDIIAQWTNQGIRFSTDPETSMGLVQHEGGPCGVLAAIQAFVLKYLIFFADELGKIPKNLPQNLTSGRSSNDIALGVSDSLAEDRRTRALVRSMGEILFSCGSNSRAVIATLSVLDLDAEVGTGDESTGHIIAKVLEGLPFETASDLQKYLRVTPYTTHANAFHRLETMVPVFESRMGALLFLLSALLSRGLDSIQADRDDPGPPLVTAPFGHASQEIVNLLLCGQAVPNVFDGRMDLGGGMFLKGISTEVEVGFLTLLESLNFCKVGRNLKRPKWPIWVIGSESHYTVLFALESNVQEENEMEERESQIRKAFNAQDQSGGGGFISVEGFQLVLQETRINLPNEKLNQLCSSGFIVWSEFWQVLLDLEKHMGGLKDPTGLMGKVFDSYHFNGIAKSVINGNHAASGSEAPVQRPRLTKLRVSVPPRWTPEEFMATAPLHGGEIGAKDSAEVQKPEVVQHAPLVDCIRTRWPRAVCNWVGDPPSIV